MKAPSVRNLATAHVETLMQAVGVSLNWITKTGDQFAERSPGFVINAVSTYVVWPGAVLAAWGVFTRL